MAFNAIQRNEQEPIDAKKSWVIFYVRRYFRLAPVYYFALIIVALFSVHIVHGFEILSARIPGMNESIYSPRYAADYSFLNILLHATFLFGFLPDRVLSTALPDWSLGLEMQFYLLFPFIYLLLRRYGYITITTILTVLCVMVTLWFAKLDGIRGSIGLFPEPSFILLKLPVFLIGILICDANIRKDITMKQRISMYILAFALIRTDVFLYPYFRQEIWWLIIPPALMIFLISDFPVFQTSREIINRLLDNKFFTFMSEASYSVYLLHGLFISLIGGCLYSNSWFINLNAPYQTLILWLGVLTSSYTSACIVNKHIEKPGILYGKYLIIRLQSNKWFLHKGIREPGIRNGLNF